MFGLCLFVATDRTEGGIVIGGVGVGPGESEWCVVRIESGVVQSQRIGRETGDRKVEVSCLYRRKVS